MQRQLEITETRFPGWSCQDPKVKQQVAIAKAKAAALEIEKKNRIQAAANQAIASGGANNTPVPAQKPMSEAMQVSILLQFNPLPTFHNSGSYGGDNCSPSLSDQQGRLGKF